MDKAWWRKYAKELKGFAGERITSSNNCPGAVTKKFSQGKNSGAGAMSLAECLGARKIILLGYDCKVSGGKRHWHGDHPKGLGNALSLPKWPQQFADMAVQLGHVNIINASRDTALNLWPRVPLEQALCDA